VFKTTSTTIPLKPSHNQLSILVEFTIGKRGVELSKERVMEVLKGL